MTLTPCGLAAAVAAPLVWMALADDDRHDPLPYGEMTPFSLPTTTTSTSTPRTYPTTTTIPAEPIEIAELPGPYTRVVATSDGIVLTTQDGSLPLRRLTRDGVPIAFGAGDGRVVWQEYGDEASGRIVIRDALADHEVFGATPSHGADGHTLHDVAFVGGRPYAVVSTTAGHRPEDREGHLLLVDLETFRRLDLGGIGGWEEWVSDARLLPNGDVIALVGHLGGHQIERRRLDGTTAWSVAVTGDEVRTLTLRPIGTGPYDLTVVVLEPTYVEDADHPTLTIREHDLETGAELTAPIHHRVVPTDGLTMPATFCSHAEADQGTLLCDGGRGPSLRIDVADGTARAEPGSPPYGTMTTWRFDE